MTAPPGARIAHRGTVYLLVLIGSLIVAVVGVTSLSLITMQARDAQLTADAAEARLIAQSAVELGIQRIHSDRSWRSSVTRAEWSQSFPIGGGSASVMAYDPVDNDPANNSVDPIVLRGAAVRRSAVQFVEVTLTPRPSASGVLSTALHVAGDIAISASSTVRSDGLTISSNYRITNNGTISAPSAAPSFAGSGAYTISPTFRAASLASPGVTVIRDYASRAAACAAPATVEHVVLSPASNPFGPTHPDGLYVINASSNVTIRNMRLFGTLVVIAPGRTVRIEDTVLMEPARPGMPTLLIEGHARIEFYSSETLSESKAGVSFNPPGTPYLGEEDSKPDDEYPCEIRGMVHVSDSLIFDNEPRIVGTVLCDYSLTSAAVSIAGELTFVQSPALIDAPPQGYEDFTILAIVRGSWKRIVAP